jgi:ferrous iron transport protein A
MSTLAELAVGQAARVASVAGADEISVRLMEMGLVPGTEVRVLGVAPLGDPLELEVRGYRLSVRKSEAARVELSK